MSPIASFSLCENSSNTLKRRDRLLLLGNGNIHPSLRQRLDRSHPCGGKCTRPALLTLAAEIYHGTFCRDMLQKLTCQHFTTVHRCQASCRLPPTDQTNELPPNARLKHPVSTRRTDPASRGAFDKAKLVQRVFCCCQAVRANQEELWGHSSPTWDVGN